MSRCDYDGVFYRVFCVTLLATAFTFTVILTNVFIDIDGLLSKKAKQKHENIDSNGNTEDGVTNVTDLPNDITIDNIYEKNYIDEQPDTSYRTKRSVDTPNLLSHLKNYKMINILTNQLRELLEQSDDALNDQYEVNGGKEESTNDIDDNNKPLEEDYGIVEELDYDQYKDTKTNDDNIDKAILRALLRDISDHVDISKVYKEVDELNRKLKNKRSHVKEPDIMVKTIIEVKPMELKKIETKKISKSRVKSKITSKKEYNLISKGYEFNDKHKLRVLKQKSDTEKHDTDDYFRKAVEHLEKQTSYTSNKDYTIAEMLNKNYSKRSKRQIKVKYEEYNLATPKIKPVRKRTKKTDDELYIEIETHFDSTGAKGEKKKKLVKSLIDKIQKAIRSDQSRDSNTKKLHRSMHIKKRTQNPIKYKDEKLSNNYISKMNSVEHRQLNPINKIVTANDIPQDKDYERIENWEQPYFGTNNFNMPNVEDSEEINNPNPDLGNVLSSGIPQRVQVPLNNHNSKNNQKSQTTNTDTGNVTLFIKDIDGSGFSVGFNQYVDEPPDVDSMKLFTGLENLIETYHENYDQNNNDNANEIDDSVEKHELMKRNVNMERNEHVLLRRSVQELNNEDYHSNAYKLIFDKKILPNYNYNDILQRQNKNSLTSNYEYKVKNYNYNPKNIKIFTKDIKIKALPVIFDNDILVKKLSQSEILNLARLLFNNVHRKKRSMNVRKITNLKSRIKLNRYLNTNDMRSRTIFLKNKRNKREVNKIRIIASDSLHEMPKQSEENIFLVSGENLFTNRAVIREIELPESDTGDEGVEEEATPYTYEETNPESYITNIFDTKYRHNALMSKYPHLFTGSVTESKEVHFDNNNEYLVGRSDKQKFKLENLLGMHVTTENIVSAEKDVQIPEIVNAIMPSPPKTNYKVTVKISPKNLTNPPSGFKEMHTVINKTYNNNGVQYYSLVNVSEISKIENINKSKEHSVQNEKSATTSNPVTDQKNNIKLLLALQKQKIEQQLMNLNRQKEGLEKILRERDGIKERNFNDLLREFIHVDSEKHDDLAFVNQPYVNHAQIHTPAVIEQSTFTTSLATEKNTEKPQTTTVKEEVHTENTKLNASIKENEHLTNEILSKINKNTDILQTFLQKLSEKFDKQLTDWGMNLHHLHDTFFNEHIPSKNDSHYAIPFVYAYQHPYMPQNKQPIPMAKIVYHGHIHTNAVHKHPNDLRNNNHNVNNSRPHHPSVTGLSHDTKFFIDTMPRESGVVHSKHGQKDFHSNVNTTNLQ
ncbi:uncharacterized protein MAL8P1.12-like [Battus philenor]|uniref:uncharacterized protein MAL8P1.12-like n=1 Tax=Battus philenor TaxID=42288 RepID=UPI0035D07FB6